MSESEIDGLSQPSPEMVPDLRPSEKVGLEPYAYMKTRVEQYQEWYDGKAGRYKRLYLWGRIVAVIVSTLVPVVVNIDFTGSELVVSALGLVAAVLVALEGVLHHREQWENYRTAEQSLGHERIQYLAGVGPYGGLRPDQAYTRFVERVESTIRAENVATLSVLAAPARTGEQE